MVFPHPGRGKGDERNPEKQVHVGPQDTAVHVVDRMQHVMMVIPVDPDMDEAENVADEDRPERKKIPQAVSMRRVEFQDHDCDEDGDDAVTEGFEPVFSHGKKAVGLEFALEETFEKRRAFRRRFLHHTHALDLFVDPTQTLAPPFESERLL